MKRAVPFILALAVLASLSIASSTFAADNWPDAQVLASQSAEAAPSLSPTPVIPNRIAINFSPYIDGQNPNTGIVLPETQIRERLAIVAPYASWVRTYGCGNGLEATGRIAHEMGLQVAVTAWIGRDGTVNQQQLSCLITQANAGHVDLAIVGSEALLRGDVSVTTLIGYITQVRQAIPASIPVTTADVYSVFNRDLVQSIDLILLNIYPFWEGYDVQNAVAMVNNVYNQMATDYPTKRVYISETGWPNCGSHGGAIGSLPNAALYFNDVGRWAHDHNVALFYFEAFDETWKANYEGPQGVCWGIWDKFGNIKPGMSSVFDGTFGLVAASSQLPGWEARALIDGNTSSTYGSGGHFEHLTATEWAAVRLPARTSVDRLRIYDRFVEGVGQAFPKDFVIGYAWDGDGRTCNPANSRFSDLTNWKPLLTYSGYPQPTTPSLDFAFQTVQAGCFRLLATQLTQDGFGARYLQLNELELYRLVGGTGG